jgi:hypothetical protein
MSPLQIVIIIGGVLYFIYSSIKGNEAQNNKKTPSNPTPSKKSTLDDMLDKMLEQQKRRAQASNKPDPKDEKRVNKKLVFKENKKPAKQIPKQGMPFEKRKFTEPREMPSRKQIERVTLREKKATEAVVINVKDYDLDIINHESPHMDHSHAKDSNIKFHFKEDEKEVYTFDARQAIISQIILERKF